MTLKKKLGLGVASAALGIALVGGGTWALFNDVEKLEARYGAGILDLKVDDITTTGINLSNLKPGDVFEKEFELDAIGTLAIKDVLLNVKWKNFNDYTGSNDPDIGGRNSAEEFLSQFTITVLSIGTEGGNGYKKDIVKNVNLLDFINMTNGGGKPATGFIDDTYYDKESGRINVVTKTGPDGRYHGLPVNPDDQDKIKFIIKFNDPDEKDENGVQKQNKFQGDSITLEFIFEARQWGGLDVKKEHVDKDGYIKKNEESHSEGDGSKGGQQPGGGGDDDNQNPGGGGDDDNQDPGEITLESVKITEEKWWTTGVILKKYHVKATAEFTFSDGIKKHKTVTINEANKDGQQITFTVKHNGKEYSKTFILSDDNKLGS